MSLGNNGVKAGTTKWLQRFLKPVKWLFRSSILRLAVLLSGLFTLGMAVAIFVALSFGYDAIIERTDASLQALATSIKANEEIDDRSAAIILPVTEINQLPRQFSRVLDQGRGTIELNRNYRRSEEWRVLIAKDSGGTPILLALPLDDSRDALGLLSEILWTTAMIVICVALLIGLAFGYFAQRRLARINKTLGLLAKGDLQARTHIARSNDDLDEVAQQLDNAADELERLVSQTRHLSASIAHDLRTPLARLRAHLEMLPQGDERGAALEEAGRLSEIFDTIMRVSRIEAGQGNEGFEKLDLGALATELEDIFGPVVEDSGKELILKTANTANIFADKQMLVQAIANLIQNAIVHGGPEITLFANGLTIGVADNGTGVDPEQYGEIIKPMVRLDAARGTDGSGLGLALVRAVADRHRAELNLQKKSPHGLRISLNFTKM